MDQQIRVLVIDDDEPHAQAVAESLERVGYDCVVATSGREGIRLIEEQTFDIVLIARQPTATASLPDIAGAIAVLFSRARLWESPEASR